MQDFWLAVISDKGFGRYVNFGVAGYLQKEPRVTGHFSDEIP